jgi:hypothetical protein
MKGFDLSMVLDAVDLVALAARLGAGPARDAAERALTVPEARIRAACAGMSEADVKVAIDCFRRGADALSDGLAMVATKGRVRPD